MKTDRQSLEALEERLNDPELYVDAIDDAVDVIIQLERERDEALKSSNRHLGAWHVVSDERDLLKSKLIRCEDDRDQLRKELETVLGSPSLRVAAEIAKARQSEIDQLRKVSDDWKDTSEMLMTVVCNASGGDWKKESFDWHVAARRFVDEYYARLKQHAQLPHVIERNKTK